MPVAKRPPRATSRKSLRNPENFQQALVEKESASFSVPRLLTPRQFCAQHGFISLGALKWWLFHRESNGLAACVVRFGKRRLLIDEAGFFQWLAAQQKPIAR